MKTKSCVRKTGRGKTNKIRVLEERIDRLEKIIEEYFLLQEDDVDYYEVNPYEDFMVPRPPQNLS